MLALCAKTATGNMLQMSYWSDLAIGAALAATQNHDSSKADKLIAEKLNELLQQIALISSPFEPKNRSAYETIRAIGKGLNENGGDDRMRRVADLVKTMGGDLRQLEVCWSWIGEWGP